MSFSDELTNAIVEAVKRNAQSVLESHLSEITLGIPGAFDVTVVASTAEPEVTTDTSGTDSSYELPSERTEAEPDAMTRLFGMVGLHNVKDEIRSLANLMKIRALRQKRGLPLTDMSLHMVFSGNPGTGKTTVARLLASIYYSIGVLPTDKMVETDRGDLVGGYVGQTALKVKDVFDSALGGVLFIDEAYSLTQSREGQDYGQEAVSTLLKLMEDHRGDIVVVVAGYTDLMADFLTYNPGLASRFTHRITFPDYTADELAEIFSQMCTKGGVHPDRKASDLVLTRYKNLLRHPPMGFGNGRDVRTFFDRVLIEQANRLTPMKRISTKALQTITVNDVFSASDYLQKH